MWGIDTQIVLAKANVSTVPENLGVLPIQSLCCTNHAHDSRKNLICQSIDAMLRNQKGLDWKGALTKGYAIPTPLPDCNCTFGLGLSICKTKALDGSFGKASAAITWGVMVLTGSREAVLLVWIHRVGTQPWIRIPRGLCTDSHVAYTPLLCLFLSSFVHLLTQFSEHLMRV